MYQLRETLNRKIKSHVSMDTFCTPLSLTGEIINFGNKVIIFGGVYSDFLCYFHPQIQNYRKGMSQKDKYWVVLVSTWWYWVNIRWYRSLLGGTGSLFGGNGQYLVVLGQYWVVLVSTWWYWVIIGWY